MLNKLRERAGDERGFTLIELLVVILIIGILAAIALPSFLGQRSKAQDTEAKSAARTAQTAMESYYTDKQSYEGATTAKLQEIEPTLPASLTVAVDTGNQGYTVKATSVTNNTFSIVKTATTTQRTCSTTGGRVGAGCNGTTW